MVKRFGRRQTIIGAGCAVVVSLLPLWDAAASVGPMCRPTPFSRSRTLMMFSAQLLAYSTTMPGSLRRQLEALFDEPAQIRDTPEMERRRAERVSMMAVQVFAARALRQAGYHGKAAECEAAIDLRTAGSAACSAQHAIGREYRDVFMKGAAQIAYGAAAFGANAVVAATSPEDRWVPDAGDRAAWALLSFENCADKRSWVWRTAVDTINSCMAIAG